MKLEVTEKEARIIIAQRYAEQNTKRWPVITFVLGVMVMLSGGIILMLPYSAIAVFVGACAMAPAMINTYKVNKAAKVHVNKELEALK